MKAVLFDGKLSLVKDAPVPLVGRGEALVRVSLAGICGTDLEIVKGYAGFRGIPGHEFAGIVERVEGKDRGILGKRVVGEINIGCGACPFCLEGLQAHCPQRKVLGIRGKDGAMAEYLTLPVENLHKVPEGVPDEEAVFAEPLAAAFQVLEHVAAGPSDSILVLGDGRLGILISLVLGLGREDVTLVGKHSEKLRVASRMGVRTIHIDELKPEKRYSVVVEATGSPGGLVAALEAVKPRGTIVLKSTLAAGAPVDLSPAVTDEITLVGSRCGPFGPALKAIEDRSIDVRPLITGVYGFEQAGEAFEKASQKDSIKVLLDFRTDG